MWNAFLTTAPGAGVLPTRLPSRRPGTFEQQLALFLHRLRVEAVLRPLMLVWLTKKATGSTALRSSTFVVGHDYQYLL